MNCALLQDQIFKTTVEMWDYKIRGGCPDPFPETTTRSRETRDTLQRMKKGFLQSNPAAEKCAHIEIATIRISESTHDVDDRSKSSQPMLHNMYIFI